MPPKRAAKKVADDVFADQVFALSGTLTQTRSEIQKLLEENGATVASSVTKKVTHLVTTAEDFASAPAKVVTAQKNGIFIVNEDYIHDSIKAGSAKKEDSYLLSKKRKAEDDDEEEEEEEEVEKKPKGKKAAAKKSKKEEVEEEEEEEEEKPKPKKAGRGKKAAAKVEEEEEEEEEEKPKPKRGAAKKKAVEDKESESESSEEEEDEGAKKKVVVKGRAAVDVHCGQASSCHVLEEGGVIYDAMLNQTNIANNNNKFYVIQVLEKDGGGQYFAWNRWGRVGEPGQNKLEPCGSNKEKAIKSFEKKFKDKTKNNWADRKNFQSVKGLYTLIEIDYGAEEPSKKVEKKKEKKKDVKRSDSKLDERVQDLVKLIFDLKMMEHTMTEMEYDIKKMPLGNLTKTQIKNGYQVLKDLDEAIKNGKSRSYLAELSSKFYTLIPHTFGRSVPPTIDTSEKLKSKMNMLEALADIEIATKLMEKSEEDDSTESPIDTNYKLLNCDIEALDKSSEEFKQILAYVNNTHQNGTPKIQQVYRINRKGEKDRFNDKVNLGNRKLLWHGSRLTNYVGIISQGLRIAPPEAPVSGYRFGKGIYFADIMSLSSIYCRSQGSNDFCMLLGDVALGKEAELARDTYMEKPQPGSHSTKALGTIEPDSKSNVTHEDGYIIPSGKIVNSGQSNVSCREHQYIVYDVSQVHLKYMLHLNWK